VLRYRLEDGSTSIGDFNMIDDRRALIIERDDGEGDPYMACATGTNPPGCFAARHGSSAFICSISARRMPRAMSASSAIST
jgi:hypothetical protein